MGFECDGKTCKWYKALQGKTNLWVGRSGSKGRNSGASLVACVLSSSYPTWGRLRRRALLSAQDDIAISISQRMESSVYKYCWNVNLLSHTIQWCVPVWRGLACNSCKLGIKLSPLLSPVFLSCCSRFCCQLLAYCSWWMLEKTAATFFNPSCIPRTALEFELLQMCTRAPSCCSRQMPMQVRKRSSVCRCKPACRCSNSYVEQDQCVVVGPIVLLVLDQERECCKFVTSCDAANCEM